MKDFKLAALLLIGFGVAARLLPHPANFAPITALALFGGVYLPKRYAILIPLVAMLLSDYFIGFWGRGMLVVYGSFALSGTIGLWLRNHKTTFNVFCSSLAASSLFFLLTNIPWIHPNTWYSFNLQGLLASYTNALPFFRNTLAGDLFYAGVFFAGYESVKYLAKHYLPARIYRLAF